MIAPAARHVALPMPLSVRRAALLVRIQAAREQTASVVQYLAADVRATEQSRRSIQTGWKVFKAAAVAAGVIWSFNATSRLARGRRFFTLAVSMLSTMRAMRRASAFLLPFLQSTQSLQPSKGSLS